MSHGKTQLAPQTPLGRRVVTVSHPAPADFADDVGDLLVVNVLKRRWMLLCICALLSAVAGLSVIYRFSLPKATSFGQLRYVDLPPTLTNVYTPPQMLEFSAILQSNEILAQLAQRSGQEIQPKELRKLIRLDASQYSKIVDIELKWNDGQQAINMVNELMRIACETIAANRKETLSQYAVEAELQYEGANQSVVRLRDQLIKLRQDRDSQLSDDAAGGSATQSLISKIGHTEQALDDLMMRRLSMDRQLLTLRSDVETLRSQLKSELVKSRRQQIEGRKRFLNASSEPYRQLESLAEALNEFASVSDGLDYETWRTKLELIGNRQLGPLDAASLAGVNSLERQLSFKEAKIEQIEFEMLPMDGNMNLLENRRESLERRLADAVGATDMTAIALEEAQVQLEEAMLSRSRLLDHLNNIRRGQETDFDEMTIMTAASWQTTETSDGKLKLFVLTFGCCFIALVLPVFALEHLYPSGDPAERAAKSLGIPCVSHGTFVSQPLSQDRSALYAVNSEAMRLLALRIQQCVPGPGSLVLFSGLNHEKSSIPMISYLAECLTRREERVLIIDACDRPDDPHSRSTNDDWVKDVMAGQPATAAQAAPSSAVPSSAENSARSLPANLPHDSRNGLLGLADFLRHTDVQAEQMICATSIPGVDIIPCGTTSFPREGLAASSLTSLLNECRERYTVILVAGPSTDHPSDLQMLSARADGILFTVPPNGRPAGDGESVVRDLVDMGAPVIGIVS